MKEVPNTAQKFYIWAIIVGTVLVVLVGVWMMRTGVPDDINVNVVEETTVSP